MNLLRRLVWGRSATESLALAHAEAARREYRAAVREGRCFIVHAPEIEGGYCEVHRHPVYENVRCPAAPGS